MNIFKRIINHHQAPKRQKEELLKWAATIDPKKDKNELLLIIIHCMNLTA